MGRFHANNHHASSRLSRSWSSSSLFAACGSWQIILLALLKTWWFLGGNFWWWWFLELIFVIITKALSQPTMQPATVPSSSWVFSPTLLPRHWIFVARVVVKWVKPKEPWRITVQKNSCTLHDLKAIQSSEKMIVLNTHYIVDLNLKDRSITCIQSCVRKLISKYFASRHQYHTQLQKNIIFMPGELSRRDCPIFPSLPDLSFIQNSWSSEKMTAKGATPWWLPPAPQPAEAWPL